MLFSPGSGITLVNHRAELIEQCVKRGQCLRRGLRRASLTSRDRRASPETRRIGLNFIDLCTDLRLQIGGIKITCSDPPYDETRKHQGHQEPEPYDHVLHLLASISKSWPGRCGSSVDRKGIPGK
ncbi:hypothetical protein PI87_18590 [Ralstonia sp. A12]|nr:hypothetical protein PI87_18590 [Ralstonia sp. A12]